MPAGLLPPGSTPANSSCSHAEPGPAPASQEHAGLILVSAKTFPQDRSYTAAVTSALSALLDQSTQRQPGQVTFLPRR